MGDASSADPGISATGGREDILALWLGLLVFLLALPSAAGLDLVGWVVTTRVWTDPAKALAPASRTYHFLGGAGPLLATYGALLAMLTFGTAFLKSVLRRFSVRYSVRLLSAILTW